MDYGIKGAHALIAGGATGIGYSIARTFIQEGARVTISGLNAEEVQTAVTQLGSAARGIAGDLTHAEDAEELYEFAKSQSSIDFLINSVGIFAVHDFFDIPDEEWFRYFDVNVMTAIRLSRLVLRDMLDRGEGSITFISSESGVKPQPWMAHYGAMKSCLLGVSRALAELTSGTSVRVNTILPGPTNTDAVSAYHREIAKQRGITHEQVVAEYFEETEPTSLIRRMIEPDEIARSVLHLAATPSLNGMAMRAEGGTIRAIV